MDILMISGVVVKAPQETKSGTLIYVATRSKTSGFVSYVRCYMSGTDERKKLIYNLGRGSVVAIQGELRSEILYNKIYNYVQITSIEILSKPDIALSSLNDFMEIYSPTALNDAGRKIKEKFKEALENDDAINK